MTSMIERIAQAIEPKLFALNLNQYEYSIKRGDSPEDARRWADLSFPLDRAFEKSRIALEIIKNPTEGMIQAGYNVETNASETELRRSFTAMIQAALEEK